MLTYQDVLRRGESAAAMSRASFGSSFYCSGSDSCGITSAAGAAAAAIRQLVGEFVTMTVLAHVSGNIISFRWA